MTISMRCPCGREYRLKESFAGKKIRCKDCNEVLEVPHPGSGAEAEVDEFDALMKLGRHQEASQPALPPRVVKRRPKVSKRDVDRDDDYDEPPPRKLLEEGWFGSSNGGILGGVFMVLIAVVWFGVGLAAGRIYFYPPILLIAGLVSIVKGLL